MANDKPYCPTCPLSLYNRNIKIAGTGNVSAGITIVVPFIDRESGKANDILANKVVKEITAHYHSATGEELVNYCYITSAIKCNYNVKLPIDDNVTSKCLYYLRHELVSLKPRTTLLIGDAVRFVLGVSVKESIGKIYYKNGYYYVTNYNPLCKHYDEDEYKVFKKELDKFFNAIAYNNYKRYLLVCL